VFFVSTEEKEDCFHVRGAMHYKRLGTFNEDIGNIQQTGNARSRARKRQMTVDEGMTNGPPIFAYLVFGPGRVSLERLLRPIKAAI
jgi:hypothetical protein